MRISIKDFKAWEKRNSWITASPWLLGIFVWFNVRKAGTDFAISILYAAIGVVVMYVLGYLYFVFDQFAQETFGKKHNEP